jgi:hypothetical protein
VGVELAAVGLDQAAKCFLVASADCVEQLLLGALRTCGSHVHQSVDADREQASSAGEVSAQFSPTDRLYKTKPTNEQLPLREEGLA